MMSYAESHTNFVPVLSKMFRQDSASFQLSPNITNQFSLSTIAIPNPTVVADSQQLKVSDKHN